MEQHRSRSRSSGFAKHAPDVVEARIGLADLVRQPVSIHTGVPGAIRWISRATCQPLISGIPTSQSTRSNRSPA